MIPRIRIAHLPTPVEALPKLTLALGGPKLFVKRDDQTGLAFGGNKTRKLEYLIAEAQAHGAKTLITSGAVQSNHCRQTAAAAAKFGLRCILVLSGQIPNFPSANLLLDHLFGAEIVWSGRREREVVLHETFQRAWNEGRRPYLVPYGGSSPTGAAAYTFALQELLEQVQDEPLSGCPPNWIVFASSSGGTQAGLALGAKLFGFQGKILGISVDEPAEELNKRVAALAGEIADHIGESGSIVPENVLVNDDYNTAGYGVLGDSEREAIRLFAQSEGLLLDPVYTGRAAAGMIDLIRQGFFSSDDTILFWHTGGTPGLFADKYRNLIEKWRSSNE
ncbi:MAG: D-cysteine desulfhydrase family protein [Anaerolineales bacterium]|jgi:D-cysteine desulfhydrase family pyridoxal phosphate-dependent enzyme